MSLPVVLTIQLCEPEVWTEDVEAAFQRHLRVYELKNGEYHRLMVGPKPTEDPLAVFGRIARVIRAGRFDRVHIIYPQVPGYSWDFPTVSNLIVWLRQQFAGSTKQVEGYSIIYNPLAHGTISVPSGWIWKKIQECDFCQRPVRETRHCDTCYHTYCIECAGKHLEIDKSLYDWKEADQYLRRPEHPWHRRFMTPYYMAIRRARHLARLLSNVDGIKGVGLYGSLARRHTREGGGLVHDIDLILLTDAANGWVHNLGGNTGKYPTISYSYLYVWLPEISRRRTARMGEILYAPRYTKQQDLDHHHRGIGEHLLSITHDQFILWPTNVTPDWLEQFRKIGKDRDFPESMAADVLWWTGADFVADTGRLPGYKLLRQPLAEYRFDKYTQKRRPLEEDFDDEWEGDETGLSLLPKIA